MKPEKFSEAMNYLDDKYIEKAINYQAKKQSKPMWIKWASVAACLCLLIVVTVVSVFLCKYVISSDEMESNVKIVFPAPGGEQSVFDVAMNYNLSTLKKQKKDMGKYSYVHSDPVKTDYAIVEKLGFEDKDEISSGKESDENRWFKKGDSFLRIGKYGDFTYSTGAEDTYFDMPLSLNECKSIAKKYISDLGLMGESMSSRWTADEMSVTTDGVTTVIGYGVNMFVEVDGLTAHGCNRITVNINGKGEVTDVYYTVESFNKKEKTAIVDIEDALARIDEGKCLFGVDDEANELNFEKVSLAYWKYETEDMAYLIPVYVFEGTSTAKNGNKDTFSIIVQAN